MQKTVDRMYELYLIQNHHYLIQLRGGHYITRNGRRTPLRLHHFRDHLNGKSTVGTFSGAFLTKFICFDVDFREPAVAKWVTYKLVNALDEAGLHDYAVSFSGNKGYHVELFFDKALSVDAGRRFFDFIVYMAEVGQIAGGDVEFRPSATQGVKLPLGVHQKTSLYCGFCSVGDGLRVIDRAESLDFFHAIKKTSHSAITDLIADERAYDSRSAADMENAISRHKALPIYDQSESYTLSRAADRYYNGLTGPGQRHKSFLLLARLMNHNGVDRADALEAITEWFAWQDRRFYSSEWAFCIADLRECVDHVYDTNKTLLVEQRDLAVTFAEVDAIIRRCPLKNQKALTYAMLIHSKRLAGESGAFYMTYKQMEEAVGIDERTARRQVNQLDNLGVIEIFSRNQKQRGTYRKKPNFYRMTLVVSDAAGDGEVFHITDKHDIGASIRHFYTEDEIRSLLPRRQQEAVLAVS